MRKMKIKERNERAQEVLSHFLDNMGYWREVEYLVKGLSEEDLELDLPEDYFKGRAPRTRKPYGKGNIRRLSLNETAHLMGISNVVLANGIKAGTFPWAYAIQGRGTRYVYFINAEKFSEIEGIPLPMEGQA